jgi:hypothetical protein
LLLSWLVVLHDTYFHIWLNVTKTSTIVSYAFFPFWSQSFYFQHKKIEFDLKNFLLCFIMDMNHFIVTVLWMHSIFIIPSVSALLNIIKSSIKNTFFTKWMRMHRKTVHSIKFFWHSTLEYRFILIDHQFSDAVVQNTAKWNNLMEEKSSFF